MEQSELDTVRGELEQARETIAHLERKQNIDSLLRDADTIDLEAARLLTQHAVEAMDEPDVAMAVTDLKRHKPYLFRHRAVGAGMSGAEGEEGIGVMGPRADAEGATGAAERAVETGSRRDLLAYLRLRRRA